MTMYTSFTQGVDRVLRVSHVSRLTLLGTAIAVFGTWAQAADAISSQLDITGIRYTVSPYGAGASDTPTVVLGGAPLSAHFYQEFDYAKASGASAVSADGTRQVQLGSTSWSMSAHVGQQDVADIWATQPPPDYAGQGRLGVMVSTIPPEQFVLPSSDPQDYIQFTLSPHSQLSWSATMDLSFALNPQLLADTLKSHATDTLHPMLMVGGVFYGGPVVVDVSEEQAAVLEALGHTEIYQDLNVTLEFDAQGNWTMDGTPGHVTRDVGLTMYNPFDTELTYAVSMFAAQEQVFYTRNLNFNPSGVPEPGSWALMGLGLLGLALRKRQGCSHL
jgi:hypothetical protein